MRILLGGGGREEDIPKANITKMGYEVDESVKLGTMLFALALRFLLST